MAGVACQQTYKPKISPTEYPVLGTRPMTSMVKVVFSFRTIILTTPIGDGSNGPGK